MPSVSVALPFMMLSSLLPFRVIVVITGTFKVVSATFLSKVAVAGLMVGGVVSSTPMTGVAVLGAPMAFAEIATKWNVRVCAPRPDRTGRQWGTSLRRRSRCSRCPASALRCRS